MTADQPVLSSSDDEIDLRDVFAALQRRWGWFFGGGLLGFAFAAGSAALVSPGPIIQASMIVNAAQGPCYSRTRQLKIYKEPSLVDFSCFGELDAVRQELVRLVKSRPMFVSAVRGNSSDDVVYSVNRLVFDDIGQSKSSSHIVLEVEGPSYLAPKILDELMLIQKRMTLEFANKATADGFKPFFGDDWIRVEKPSELIEGRNTFSRLLTLCLLGGLVLGAGAALIADWRSNRVYSQAQLFRYLGYPLRLGLPAGPWTSSAVEVLVGQLATQLDQSLSWRVFSIAKQHEAVVPLTQLLQQQGGADLQCESADPLLSVVLRLEPHDQPTGLLVVVEPGFNSARALEEARLLISQMSNVQAVGVVLIGMPLPEELSSSLVG